ncbi:unnamed protein product [Cuscuta epithymum]|uniref:Uncharacterized protein n=1 Tax=Cuscuta epithymum TaxID=186058 RepID=A0AAV0FN61_9ASTE|nr:unnamed protein product [Cuscuta epithymum]
MTIGTKVPGSVRNRRWTPEIEKEGFAGEEAQVLARLSDHFHAGGGETTVAQTAADDRRRSTPLSCTCRPPDNYLHLPTYVAHAGQVQNTRNMINQLDKFVKHAIYSRSSFAPF